MRVQDPEIFATEGKNPRWFIRPFVDSFDQEGNAIKRQIRIYLGRCDEMKKREAITKKNEVMARINKSQVVLQAQLRFGALLDHYLAEFVRRPNTLSVATQTSYEYLIENHIEPAWGEKFLGEIRGLEIDRWLSEKGKPKVVGDKIKPGLSWQTRTHLRNLMSGIFTKAREWGLWRDENPVMYVSVGRKVAAYTQRKLTIEETRQILGALPDDVRLICETALFCTLRISEVLGLSWQHIDFERGLILVRQRFYRGDLDQCKTRRAVRDVPMGDLATSLAALHPGPGHEKEFVFSVKTYANSKNPRTCRDDRDINQHFLRKAAKAKGFYWKGFGFHAFRREAVTAMGSALGTLQAQRMAGHARADMSLDYTLADHVAQERAVRELQARVRGEVVEIRKGA